jgi:hypothetical protein
MYPAASLRTFTPSSTPLASVYACATGVVLLLHTLHGHAAGVAVGVAVAVPTGVGVGALVDVVTVMPAEGVSRLPLSSTARLLRVHVPPDVGCQE